MRKLWEVRKTEANAKLAAGVDRALASIDAVQPLPESEMTPRDETKPIPDPSVYEWEPEFTLA